MTRTVIQLRCSGSEKAVIEGRAKAAGLSVSEFLRKLAVGDAPEPPALTPGPDSNVATPSDVERRARQLHNSRGLTTSLARREAFREAGG